MHSKPNHFERYSYGFDLDSDVESLVYDAFGDYDEDFDTEWARLREEDEESETEGE